MGKFILRAQFAVITRDVIGLDHNGFLNLYGDKGGDVVDGLAAKQVDAPASRSIIAVEGLDLIPL